MTAQHQSSRFLGVTALGLLAGSTMAAAQTPPQWDTSLGTPDVTGSIFASTMYDDGSGPALYAGGDWVTINGTRAWGIAKTYDGKRWYPLAGGLRNGTVNTGIVRTMKVFDFDGAGPNPPVLVVGGTFTSARNNPNTSLTTTNIAVWNGTAWSALGTGLSGAADGTVGVQSLEEVDFGAGRALYAGGDFSVAGVSDIAVWNGTSWASVGFSGAVGGWIRNLLTFDDGTGPALYAGGNFSSLGALGTTHIARWDGTTWSSVGGGIPLRIDRLIAFDADGPGGNPARLLTIRGGGLNTWDGQAWSGEIDIPGTNGLIINSGAVVYDDGSGPALYIGGTSSGSQPVRLIKYDGIGFTPMGDSMSGWMAYLGVHTLGGEPEMFLGGTFRGTDAVPTQGILGWSQGNWAPFGGFGGLAQPATLPFVGSSSKPVVTDLAAFDSDGIGPLEPQMVVTGEFIAAGALSANGLAVRSGSGWSSIGGGVPNALRYSRLLARPGAAGDELYVVAHGDISTPDSAITGAGVYRLRNGAWEALGSPFGMRGRMVDVGPPETFDTAIVSALVPVNFASGERLFALGRIGDVDGVLVDSIVQWDGSGWGPVGLGLPGVGFGNVPTSGVAFDDGSGPALFVAGAFTDRLSKWDGEGWTVVTAGLPAGGEPRVVVFGGELWAYMSQPKQLYRWNGPGQVWELQATVPSSVDSLTVNIATLIGVADVGGGDRFFFSTAAPANTAGGWGILQFDGTSWISDSTMGRTNPGGATVVRQVNSGGESSLWFGGAFWGVGGETLGSRLSLSVIPSFGVGRWFAPLPALPCEPDVNQDGNVDQGDVDYLINVIAGGPNDTSIDPDFNQDGNVDQGDIDSLVDVVAGGNCP